MNPTFFFIACSGPDALRTIQQSIHIGYFNAAFAVIATVALLIFHSRRGGFGWSLLYGVLLFIHPAWSPQSAYHGDCGYGLRHSSYLISASFIAIAAYQLYARSALNKVA